MSTAAGTHLIVDLFGCTKQPYKALPLLHELARKCGLQILDDCQYRFGTVRRNGETALVLLAESHMSIHSWPERKYVAFDLFSCKPMDEKKCARAVAEIVKAFGCTRYKIRPVERGREDR